MDPKGMQDPVILTPSVGCVHYAQGVCFALIFAFGIHPLLPIANTVLGNFAKAHHLGPDPRHDECGLVDQPLPEPPARTRAPASS